MIAYLFKPFGADNYLVLTKPEEIQELFDKIVPGDEFIVRALELSDDEFNGLGEFGGFQGPTGGEGEEGEEGSPEEESTETPEEESTEPEPTPPPPEGE